MTWGDELSANADRFAFGKNWTRFLSVVSEERVRQAEVSLRDMLGRDDLAGLSFLDVGSGSGLISLAAVRLGAARVHSFDFDTHSVAASRELRRRYEPAATHWTIEHGSILDRGYVERLGQWDLVYSWGVLHHTGDMDQALARVAKTVAPEGRLFISIYNDQGWKSNAWRLVKRACVALPPPLQRPYAMLVYLPFELRAALTSLVRLKPQRYWHRWTAYGAEYRGMSHSHDVLDWIGGYPFEVAKPERIFDFYAERGFVLSRLTTKGASLGCNEYVFARPERPMPTRPVTASGEVAGPHEHIDESHASAN